MVTRSISVRYPVAAALAVLAAGPAFAVQQAKSLYTAVDLSECLVLPDSAGGHGCPGLPGWPLYVAREGDKTFVSIGPDAGGRTAARQTLDAANTMFGTDGVRPTIEWRFIIREKKTVPYAAIIRFLTEKRGVKGEVLVVMKVSATDSCHVAYIDTKRTRDAIVLARRIADKTAREFDCRQKPVQADAGTALR